MKLRYLVEILDKIFQKDIAVANDPVGLQFGNFESEVNSALITLDITQDVVYEAIEKKVNLIISHHPLIFNPFLQIINENPKTEKILKLLENKIAIYSAHTNLDSMTGGLNELVAKKIGLSELKVLENSGTEWYKFVVFVPLEAEQNIREVICSNGGGNYKNYSCCTFNIEGTGTFKPLEGSNPYIGDVGNLEFVKEIRIECVVEKKNLKNLINAVLENHPYEEPAFDVYKLENSLTNGGLGRAGLLNPPINLRKLLEIIKSAFNLTNLRWLAKGDKDDALNRKIRKVAVINGSANSFTDRFSIGTTDFDAVIVGELKYHNALEIVETDKVFIELGHGESENLAVDLIYNIVCSSLNNINNINNLDNFNNLDNLSDNLQAKDIKSLNPKKKINNLNNLKLYKAKQSFIPWRYYIE